MGNDANFSEGYMRARFWLPIAVIVLITGFFMLPSERVVSADDWRTYNPLDPMADRGPVKSGLHKAIEGRLKWLGVI